MLAGLTELLAEDGIAPAQVSRLAHATTLVTNTLIESSGAKVGVLTTQGFRDVLEIGRMRRPSLYDLDKDKPSPLATREVRLEVRERVDAAGRVITPLKPEDVERAIARFPQRRDRRRRRMLPPFLCKPKTRRACGADGGGRRPAGLLVEHGFG